MTLWPFTPKPTPASAAKALNMPAAHARVTAAQTEHERKMAMARMLRVEAGFPESEALR